MTGKTHHFKSYSFVDGDIRIELDMSRLEGRFNKAQYALDSAIMNSMEPFMPKRDNNFINRTRAESASMAGTGRVCAAIGPQGRFLYLGETMVDSETGSPFARKGAKKVLVSQYSGKTNAKEKLTFSKSANPNVQPEWFEAAKKADMKKWVRTVEKVTGGEISG